MKRLTDYLRNCGVGFVTGNYKSYYVFGTIKRNISMPMSINFSIENKYIGEYAFLIEKVMNGKVFGVICDRRGKPIHPFDRNDEFISVMLTPNEYYYNIGTFIATSPWGKPK